jgi:hypothetical protein
MILVSIISEEDSLYWKQNSSLVLELQNSFFVIDWREKEKKDLLFQMFKNGKFIRRRHLFFQRWLVYLPLV